MCHGGDLPPAQDIVKERYGMWTGGMLVSSLTGKGKQVLVTASVAADAGEALFQVPADKILPDDVSDDRPEIAVCLDIPVRVDPLEFLILQIVLP
jgi:hypothetical protein